MKLTARRWLDRLPFVLLVASVGSLYFTASWQYEPYKAESPPRDGAAPTSTLNGPMPPTGQRIASFVSQSYLGEEVSLDQFTDQPVILLIFLGTECPLAVAYAPRLAAIARAYAGRGVRVLGIASNQQDSLSEIAAFVRQHDLPFDIVKDVGNCVADQLGATRTPEAYVLDQRRVVQYHGRIDDQYDVGGAHRLHPTREFVKDAIDSLLDNKAVSVPSTPLVGCLIGRATSSNESHNVTYCDQIVRILQQHCIACHRPGQNAPFSLTSYPECAGWAPMIAEVVQQGRMPPWHADPQFGSFSNARRLSPSEKDQILSWVSAGAPEGKKDNLPDAPKFPDGWRIEPDIVIPMAQDPFQVPATGAVDYQYFTVDPGFKEDRWIRAAEVRPGQPRAVHHIFLIASPPERESTGLAAELPTEYVVAAVPGSDPMILPPGMAKLIPAGSTLRFEVHYTPIGKPVADLSHVAFEFVDAKGIDKEVGTSLLSNTTFEIPPRHNNFKIEARKKIVGDSLLISLYPHAHLRGKSFKVEAEYPQGHREILLNVPDYHFNWQHTYRLSTPKVLPAGSIVHFTAHYDNSAENPANPDSSASVRFGPQQWNEMMLCYMEMADADTAEVTSKHPRTDAFLRAIPASYSQNVLKIRGLGTHALSTQRDFSTFGSELMEIMPQLDGVALFFVTDKHLRIRLAVFRPGLEHVEKQLRGKRFYTMGLTLPDYAREKRKVVHQSIAQIAGLDFMALRQEFAASMHLPIDDRGRPATVCFLSKEPQAFPREAVDLIEEVVEHIRTSDAP